MTPDLSLLQVFHAVMEERSVTAAAERLGQSQSTVSAALGRLRQALGDELFLRARYGVTPTERALELAPEIAEALTRLDAAFRAAEPFAADRTTRRFRLLLGPYLEVVLLPALAEALARRAPGAVLETRPLGPDLDPRLLAGRGFDLAIGRFHTPPEDLVISDLFDDGFRCLVAPTALPEGAALTREAYERLPHVVIAPPGRWQTGVFQRVEGRGLRRNTAITVSHFLSAPMALARIGGIATVPARVAALLAGPFGLRDMAAPVELGRFPSHLAWHPQARRDAGHRWLRGLVAEVAAEL